MADPTRSVLLSAVAERLCAAGLTVAIHEDDTVLSIPIEVEDCEATSVTVAIRGEVWTTTTSSHGTPTTCELLGTFPHPRNTIGAWPPWGETRPVRIHDDLDVVVAAIKDTVAEEVETVHALGVARCLTSYGFEASFENDGGGPYISVVINGTIYSIMPPDPPTATELWTVERIDRDASFVQINAELRSDVGDRLPVDASPYWVAESFHHAVLDASAPLPAQQRELLKTLEGALQKDPQVAVAFGGHGLIVCPTERTGTTTRVGFDPDVGWYIQTHYHVDPPGDWSEATPLAPAGTDAPALVRQVRLAALEGNP